MSKVRSNGGKAIRDEYGKGNGSTEGDTKSPDLRQAIIVSPNPNPLLMALEGARNLRGFNGP